MIMQRIWRFFKHELIEVLPPAFFFFVAFNVVTISKRLMLEQYHINFSGFANAAVGALVVAKAILVSDKIKFINKYPDKPLIYNVVWKTVIYGLITLVVQLIEELFPLARKYRSVQIALERGWDEIIWPHFWAIHILLIFLLSLYVSFRELARAMGEKEFLQLFIGIEVTKNDAPMEH
jgi:hypothetical protein